MEYFERKRQLKAYLGTIKKGDTINIQHSGNWNDSLSTSKVTKVSKTQIICNHGAYDDRYRLEDGSRISRTHSRYDYSIVTPDHAAEIKAEHELRQQHRILCDSLDQRNWKQMFTGNDIDLLEKIVAAVADAETERDARRKAAEKKEAL